MPKAKFKSLPAEEPMEEGDEEIPLHRAINTEESKLYVESLDTVFHDMVTNVEEGTANAMELAITALKLAKIKQIPGTEEADTRCILRVIWDPSFLAARKPTEEVEAKLEEIVPESDIISGEEIIRDIDEVEPLTKEQRQDIGEVFENLEIAHKHLGRSYGLTWALSCSLSSKQLLLLLKASIRPLVQVNKLGGFLEEPKAGKTRSDLPESTHNRVYTTMIPVPLAESIRSEKLNSPTQLLAATLAFKILHKFVNGTTQQKIQEKYNVRPKQLALYLRGRRYLGGSDQKGRVLESNKEPSTSKKLKSQ